MLLQCQPRPPPASVKLHISLRCVNLKQIPSIFSPSNIFFMTIIILPQSGRGFWLNLSRGIISSYFTHTCLHIPLLLPVLLSRARVLAMSRFWRYSTESWESEVLGWGVVVISRLTGALRGMLTPSEWWRRWHTALPFPIPQGSCLPVQWRMCWLVHCYPEPFDPYWLAGNPLLKGIPQELIGAKQYLGLCLKGYLKCSHSQLPHTHSCTHTHT